MSFRFVVLATIFTGLAVPALAQAPAPAAAPAANPSAPVTRAELPALIKEALINDPNILKEAVDKIRQNEEAKMREKAQDGLKKNKDALYNNPNDPSIGDAKTADFTIVEFFDYHCGYCKQMLPTITKIHNEDPKVRIIFKEFPILSQDSELASRAALAVNRIAKDKYFDFHSRLMTTQGKFDEKVIMDIAKKAGINTDKLKAEMGKKEISDILEANRQLAQELGITGTPSIIIGDAILPGAVPYEALKGLIAQTRMKPPTAAGEKPAAASNAPTAPVAAPAAPAAPADAPKAN